MTVRAAAVLVAAAALAGCIDPVSLEVEGETDRVVVVALVEEGPGPHTVALSFTAAFERGIDAIEPPIDGAEVEITTGDGDTVRLEGEGGGVYRTAPGALVGAVGQAYALRFRLPDGRTFASSSETMRPSPGGAQASAVYVKNEVLVGQTLVSRDQVELRVDVPDPAGEPNYYRWTWRGNYRVNVPCGFNTPPELCGIQYGSCRGISRVEVASDRLSDGGLLRDQPVASLAWREFGPLFGSPFYLEVEQQALTPGAFAYWLRVQDTRDRTGGLFDPAPDAIIGNVANVDDVRDYALGYFTVAGTSTATTCPIATDFPDRANLRDPDSDPPPPFPTFQCPGGVSPTPPPRYAQACERPPAP